MLKWGVKFKKIFTYILSLIATMKLLLRRMPTLWSVSRHLSSVTLVRSVILCSKIENYKIILWRVSIDLVTTSKNKNDY
jgi:hypothetical protein